MISLFKKKKIYTELIGAEVFNGEIDHFFGSALCKIGFENIKKNMWIQDLETGVRKIVTIMHWKGATSTPQWGYSLDYVPHFNNSYNNIFWHRTNKSAMIDVFPFYFDFSKYLLSRFTTPKEHTQKLESFTPLIIQDLNEFYDLGSDTNDLVNILEKSEAYNASGLGFWNWVQLPLAYAFTLNKIGNSQKANEFIDKYLSKHDIAPKARAKLIERFNNVSA